MANQTQEPSLPSRVPIVISLIFLAFFQEIELLFTWQDCILLQTIAFVWIIDLIKSLTY